MFVKLWHLCKILYAWPRQTRCPLSSSKNSGNLLLGVSPSWTPSLPIGWARSIFQPPPKQTLSLSGVSCSSWCFGWRFGSRRLLLTRNGLCAYPPCCSSQSVFISLQFPDSLQKRSPSCSQAISVLGAQKVTVLPLVESSERSNSPGTCTSGLGNEKRTVRHVMCQGRSPRGTDGDLPNGIFFANCV